MAIDKKIVSTICTLLLFVTIGKNKIVAEVKYRE